jgi:signal transduction histidine kinase
VKGAEGRTCWVKGIPQPLIDADKNVIGSFAVITDINDQIEVEQKLLKTEIKLRSLAKQVLYAQEIERKRIASELHDGIGQTLSAIKFYVENNISDLIESPNLTIVKRFESVIPKLQGAIEEVRRISMDLRPSLLDDIGIVATLSWFCRESKLAAPNVEFSFDKNNVVEFDIITSLKTEMFRIVQEAVNNSIKYSQAKNVTISLRDLNRTLRLEIKDDGIGFDYQNVANQQGYAESKGMGLVSMRERVQNSGGTFSLTSDAMGTTVICQWPKEKRAFVDNRSGRRDRRDR